MRKDLAIIGLALFLSLPMAKGWAVDLHRVGIVPKEEPEMQDRLKAQACDCCQECKAAQRPMKPKEEEGGTPNNGCDECCERCGRTVQPSPGDIPPEVIDEKTPPDIIEKKKL